MNERSGHNKWSEVNSELCSKTQGEESVCIFLLDSDTWLLRGLGCTLQGLLDAGSWAEGSHMRKKSSFHLLMCMIVDRLHKFYKPQFTNYFHSLNKDNSIYLQGLLGEI